MDMCKLDRDSFGNVRVLTLFYGIGLRIGSSQIRKV